MPTDAQNAYMADTFSADPTTYSSGDTTQPASGQDDSQPAPTTADATFVPAATGAATGETAAQTAGDDSSGQDADAAPIKPTLSVKTNGDGTFTLSGSGFVGNTAYIRAVGTGAKDYAYGQAWGSTPVSGGSFNVTTPDVCGTEGGDRFFSANDGRPDPTDKATGTLWSNTVKVSCPNAGGGGGDDPGDDPSDPAPSDPAPSDPPPSDPGAGNTDPSAGPDTNAASGSTATAPAGAATLPSGSTQAGTDAPAGTRPSEMIAGASGVQYSTGENTAAAGEQGGDFADSSRSSAQSNAGAAHSYYNDGSNPMQSPNLGSSAGFALRYAVGFLCVNYRANSGFSNLADIAEYSRPNSAYLRAFSGMAKSQQFNDPNRADIISNITSWTTKLAGDLPPGTQGELVVVFQGHGAHGSFFACDTGEVTTSDMMGLARAAEASRVSLTFVMDACFSGGAVPAFQDHAADSVDSGVTTNVEGAHQMSSVANHDHAEALRDQMAWARELILFSSAVARHGDTLNGIVQQIEATNDPHDWDAAMTENQALIQLIQSMQNQYTTNMHFANDPEMHLDQIGSAFPVILSKLNAVRPNTSFDYTNDWTGPIGHFQDQVSDGANRVLVLLQHRAQAGG